MSNVHAAVGAGKERKPFRIREFLSAQGKTMKAVALEMGVNPSLVQDTIRGVKNNRRVLVHLFDMGCPEDYLSLPSNVKAEISQRSMEVR